MNKKENGKRRKDDNSSSRKNKDKKEKVADPLSKSSQGANRTNGPPYAQSMMSMDSDDGIPFNGNLSMSRPLDPFKTTFRMSRKTFNYICSLVKDHMMSKTHFTFINGKPMSLNDQVALALTRLSSGNSLITIGDLFGAHHSTVSQVTWRFVEAIEEKALHHLRWPSTEAEMSEIKRKFEKIRGLPNCCGAIDTTHITMLLTSSDQEADYWLDRSKKHSMILQAVVDPDMKFRSIVTGWPGKMNNTSVLKNSSFFTQCQKGEKLNGVKITLSEETELGEYIIGHEGYPLLPWLLTPYQGSPLQESKVDFNKRLIATRFVACNALMRLKEVWKMIKGDLWRPDKHKLLRFVLVCSILHSITIAMEKDKGLAEMKSGTVHDAGYRNEICEYDNMSIKRVSLRGRSCVSISMGGSVDGECIGEKRSILCF